MDQANATGNSTPTDLGHRFARMAAVVRMTGLSRATIYRMIADNRFPTQVRIGSRAVGWRWSDLEKWSQARSSATH
jgi:prophage regulatory protein